MKLSLQCVFHFVWENNFCVVGIIYPLEKIAFFFKSLKCNFLINSKNLLTFIISFTLLYIITFWNYHVIFWASKELLSWVYFVCEILNGALKLHQHPGGSSQSPLVIVDDCEDAILNYMPCCQHQKLEKSQAISLPRHLCLLMKRVHIS